MDFDYGEFNEYSQELPDPFKELRESLYPYEKEGSGESQLDSQQLDDLLDLSKEGDLGEFPTNKRKFDGTETFLDSGTGAYEESSKKQDRGEQDLHEPDLGEYADELSTLLNRDITPTFLSSHQLEQVIKNYRPESTDMSTDIQSVILETFEPNTDAKVCRYQKDFLTITLEYLIYSDDPFNKKPKDNTGYKQNVIICPHEYNWENNRTQIRFLEFSKERMIDRIFSVSKSKDETTTLFEYGTGLILYHLLGDVCPFFPKPEMLFLTTFKDTFPSIWYTFNVYEQPYMIATEPVITFERFKAKLTKIVMRGEDFGGKRVGKILKSILLQGLLAIRLLELKGFGSNGLNPSHIGFVKAKEGDDLSFKLNYPVGAETGKGKARIIDVFKNLHHDDKYILTFLMNPIKEDPYSAWNMYTNILKMSTEPRSIEPTVFETEEDIERIRPTSSTEEMLHGFAYAFTTLVLSVSNSGDYSTILRDNRLADGNTAPFFLDNLRAKVKKDQTLDEQLAEYIIEKTLLFGPFEGVKLSIAVELISKKFDIRTDYEKSFKRLFPETKDFKRSFPGTIIGDSIYNVLRKMSSWDQKKIPSAAQIISELTFTTERSRNIFIAGEEWIFMRKEIREDYPKYNWTNLANLGKSGGHFIGKRIPFGRFQIPFTPQTVKMSKLICSSLFSILRQRKRNDAGKMVKTTRKNEPVSPIFII